MDGAIGNNYSVLETDETLGVHLNTVNDLGKTYMFPAFVLEKVEQKEEPKPEYDQQALLDKIKELEKGRSLGDRSIKTFQDENIRLSEENKSLKQQVLALQESYDEQVEEIKKYQQAVKEHSDNIKDLAQKYDKQLSEINLLKETIASLNLLIKILK